MVSSLKRLALGAFRAFPRYGSHRFNWGGWTSEHWPRKMPAARHIALGKSMHLCGVERSSTRPNIEVKWAELTKSTPGAAMTTLRKAASRHARLTSPNARIAMRVQTRSAKYRDADTGRK